MRNLLLSESRGSVESILTLIPQLVVFLIMFQLVIMQFGVVKESYLSQGDISKIAISGDKAGYTRYPLVGGGSVLLLKKQNTFQKVIDFKSAATQKVLAIAVDEHDRN